MHRYIRGLMLAAAAGVLWGCGDDPLAEGAGDITKLAATPSALYIDQGETEAIVVEAYDAAGTAREASFALTSVSGAGIDVALDESFVPAYDKDGNLLPPTAPTRVRFQVAGNVLGDYSFVVTAAGRTITIPVRVIADEVAATFEPATPEPGDTVTLTMPAGLFLTPDAGVAFTGNLAPIIVDRAPDGSSLRLIAAPTTSVPATITGVVNTAFPDLPPFTLTTTTPLVSTMAGVLGTELPATFSDVAPGTDPVVMTANAGFGFLPTAQLTFPGQIAPIVDDVSTDSTEITFFVGPNVDTTLTVTRIFFLGAPQFLYTRTSEEVFAGSVVTEMPVSLSDATPAFGQDVVVTADDGFLFAPNAQLTVDGITLRVLARAADSSSITVESYPGTYSGDVRVTGAVAPTAPLFAIPLPTDETMDLASMALAASGNSLIVVDTGAYQEGTFAANDSRYYRVTVAAETTIDISLTWTGAFDLGLYILDDPVTAIIDGADSFGSTGGGGGNGQPEVATDITLPAGDYVFAVVKFGNSPGTYTMTIATQ